MDRRLVTFLLIVLLGATGYGLYRLVNMPRSRSTGDAHIPAPSPSPSPDQAQAAATQSAGAPGDALKGPPGSPIATTPAMVPASDTLSPNPPNGMAFGGKGTFQWYRQGNVTWRIDTVSGRSCIAYATMEEWAKPLVASHGCGRRG